MNWLEKLSFRVKTGYPIDDDNYVEDGWIRYKDIFIQVLKGDTDYSIGFQHDAPDFFPVRDMHVATLPHADTMGEERGTDVK